MNKPIPTEKICLNEIATKEAEANDLLTWLQDHPNASLEDKAEVRRRLNEALQDINDLVCKTKPAKIYILR
jgi:hypothetical protein